MAAPTGTGMTTECGTTTGDDIMTIRELIIELIKLGWPFNDAQELRIYYDDDGRLIPLTKIERVEEPYPHLLFS